MSEKRRRRKGVGEGSEGSDLSETEPDTKVPIIQSTLKLPHLVFHFLCCSDRCLMYFK